MGELLDCPFCEFSNHDHYFLLQHVETMHPEGGRPSPFAVTEMPTRQVELPAEELEEGARAVSSEYIECQCGEHCLLTEFGSHLEMHHAEDIGFDEASRNPANAAAPDSTLYPGRASSPQIGSSSPTPLHIVPSGPSRPVPIASGVERPHRSTGRKSSKAVREFIDILRHSASPPSRKPSQVARDGTPRRLGVRDRGNASCQHLR